MGGQRLGRLARTTRPVALLSAAATLLGALFLCLSVPADEHAPVADRAVPTYSCPHDGGACGLRPAIGPAVLTAPPLDAPPLAGELPAEPQAPAAVGGRPHSDALPRAPGLHVLQVLRI
ncbi:hypothetical protein [Streptomyces sp. NPDC048057]|uniref:hypothetical protein n=1 Tax=Streptomyces sp. NPDC048057 TaxID=3155628 RepID=UPI0034002694